MQQHGGLRRAVYSAPSLHPEKELDSRRGLVPTDVMQEREGPPPGGAALERNHAPGGGQLARQLVEQRSQPISPVDMEPRKFHTPPPFVLLSELAQHFKNQVFIEKHVEKLKCQLAWQEDFNLFQTFKVFDRSEGGHVPLPEFMSSLLELTQLEHNRVFEEQAKLIFSRYDSDSDGLLSYAEFCQLFLPHSDLKLQDHIIARRPREYTAGLQLAADTAALLRRLLRAHLDLEQSHEYMRQSLARKMQEQNWTIGELFEAADQDKKGYLAVRDFEQILGGTSQPPLRSDDAAYLLHLDAAYLMRFYSPNNLESTTTNINGRISFQDFQNQLVIKTQAGI